MKTNIKLFLTIVLLNITISQIFSQNLNDIQLMNNRNNQQSIQGTEEISPIIENINPDSISSFISNLQNFNSRFELNENRFEVSEWIYSTFESFGYEDVKYDTFYTEVPYQIGRTIIDSTFLQRNVTCTIPGYGAPDEIFIIGAHYDSYSTNSDLFQLAPGADDNGSGVAALLEIARTFKNTNFQPKRTVVLVALAGEELMNSAYSGSMHYAETLKNNNLDVKLFTNLDMIGFNDRPIHLSAVNINFAESSMHFAHLANLSIENYTQIKSQYTGYWGADLKPFVNGGYYGVYFEENIFNPYYHTSNDVISNIDLQYCTEVIQGVTAFNIWASSMPNIVEGIKAIEPANTTQTVQFIWQANTDFDIANYVLYLSLDHGNTFQEYVTSDTTITINNLTNYSAVKYTISARTTDNYEGFAETKDLEISDLSITNQGKKQDYFKLYKNFPNPFNPITTIPYSVDHDSFINITIYDLNGTQIKTLVNQYHSSGKYDVRWDSTNDYGQNVSGGIYFCRFKADEFLQTEKMVLIK